MTDSGFPKLDEHVKEHRRATEEVLAIQHLFNTQPDQLDPEKVASFFARWLVSHIQGRDMRYVAYVRGDEKAMADGPALPHKDTAVQTDGTQELVDVRVPRDKADLVRTCTRILNDGGPLAAQLGELLSISLTQREKRLEEIAKRYRY